MRLQVQSLPLLSGLRIWRCRELWCRLQTRLGSHVAVALAEASGYSSDSTPSLGTSTCHRCHPEKEKGQNPYQKTKEGVPVVVQWLTNPTRNHEVAGLVPALAQWVNDLALL